MTNSTFARASARALSARAAASPTSRLPATKTANQHRGWNQIAPMLLVLAFLLFNPLVMWVVPAAEWGAVTIYFFVIAVGGAVLYYSALRPVDPNFSPALFALALLTKMLGCVGRYWMVYSLYDGASDAPFYHEQGQILTQYFKVFDFSVISTYQARGDGTTMLCHVTGLLYTIMPVSAAGAFFFFAFLSFIGMVFCYRAVRIAWPNADTDNYILFIFFLPSILFWPSSLGKDAWILCWTGLAAWGWVVFTRRNNLFGLIWIVVALLLLQLVRPHIAAFLALSMGAAYALYSTRGQRSVFTWLVGLVVVGGLSYYMLLNGASFLEIDELSVTAIEDRMVEQQQRTTQGGSRYAAVSIFSPTGFVVGLVTAAIRPFPWEANSLPILLTSLETMAWLVLLWRQRRACWQRLRSIRGDPMAGFALFYALAMFLALTSIGNFGIIARQRVMALPFFWMLFV
ncbi:MAG: hypothetical protein R3C14_33765 [Caldilineaceae bacterium]